MRTKTAPGGAQRNAKDNTATKAIKHAARPARPLTGYGLGKGGAKRLGRLLKRAIQNQLPLVRAKGSVPKTPIRLLKHQIKTRAENALKQAKPNLPDVPQLILAVVSQYKCHGGISMPELKQALAAGGYVTKTNRRKNVVTHRQVNNEPLVQTTSNAAPRLNNRTGTTTQVRTSSVKSPYSKADLRHKITARKSFKRVERLQRQTRKIYKPKGKTHKPTAKPISKTHKAAAKPTGKTHKAAAKPTGKTHKAAAKPTSKTHKPTAKLTGKTHKAAAKLTGKTHKPTAKLTGKTHKAAAKLTGKTHKPTAKLTGKTHKPTAKLTGKTHKPTAKLTGETHKPTAKSTSKTHKAAAKPTGKTLKAAAKLTGKTRKQQPNYTNKEGRHFKQEENHKWQQGRKSDMQLSMQPGFKRHQRHRRRRPKQNRRA